jgi:hypothetical protein
MDQGTVKVVYRAGQEKDDMKIPEFVVETNLRENEILKRDSNLRMFNG